MNDARSDDEHSGRVHDLQERVFDGQLLFRHCQRRRSWDHLSARTYASAWSTADGRMGRWRKRTPDAAKIALPMAGATTVVPGSPRPTEASTLSMNSISSPGTSSMRNGV